MEELAKSVDCMTCGNTVTREEYNQLEDAISLIREGYMYHVENGKTED